MVGFYGHERGRDIKTLHFIHSTSHFYHSLIDLRGSPGCATHCLSFIYQDNLPIKEASIKSDQTTCKVKHLLRHDTAP